MLNDVTRKQVTATLAEALRFYLESWDGGETRWFADAYEVEKRAREALAAYEMSQQAAPKQAQAGPWQPIETAPTDHFPRLLRVRGLTMQGFRDVAGHWNVQTETSPHWRKLRGKPSHWMPLPQPPKEQP